MTLNDKKTAASVLGLKILILALITFIAGPFSKPDISLIVWVSVIFAAGAAFCLWKKLGSVDLFIYTAVGSYIILCQTLSLLPDFAARAEAFYFYSLVFIILLFYFGLKNEKDTGYFLVIFGLCLCPFTELHLKRSLWTNALFVFLFINAITDGTVRLSLQKKHLPSVVCAVIFLITLFISSLNSIYPYGSFHQFSFYIFNFLAFSWIVLRGRNEKFNDAVIKFLLFAAVSFTFFGLMEIARRCAALGWDEGLTFRAFVFDRHPNYVTFYITLAAPLLFGQIFKTGSLRGKLGYGAATAASLVYLFFTYSRTAWLSILLFAGLGFVIFFRLVNPRRLVVAALLLIIVTGAAAIFHEQLPAPLVERWNSITDLSGSPRLKAWKYMLQITADYPVLGPGLDTKRFLFPMKKAAAEPYQPVTRQYLIDSHNTYIEILSSSGIIGLIGLLLFIISFTAPLIKARSMPARIFLITGSGLIFDFLFHYRLHAADTGILIWILAALMTVHTPDSAFGSSFKKGVLLEGSPKAKKVITWVGVILILIISIPPLGQHMVEHGRTALSKGKWRNAYAFFSAASYLEPVNAHHHYLLALWNQSTGSMNEATENFSRSVELHPHYAFYRYYLGLAYLNMRQTEKADESLETAFLLDPFNVEGTYAFESGKVCWLLGKRNEAFHRMLIALGMNPSLALKSFWEKDDNGKLLNALLEEHVRQSVELMRSGKSWVQAKLRLLHAAAAFEKIKAFDQAENSLKVILDANRDDREAVLQLTELYINREKFDEAERLIRDALSRNYHYGMYHNALGRILTAKKEYEKAIQEFRLAIDTWTSISLDNLVAHHFLHRLYEKTGRNELALQEKQALDFLHERIGEERKDIEIHAGNINELKELDRMEPIL